MPHSLCTTESTTRLILVTCAFLGCSLLQHRAIVAECGDYVSFLDALHACVYARQGRARLTTAYVRKLRARDPTALADMAGAGDYYDFARTGAGNPASPPAAMSISR